MNYRWHYNQLIQRARQRTLAGYKEKHHVKPRCIGGSDHKRNLVWLTPEEHYVAHQLLVKIHPRTKTLVYAAHMMSVRSGKHFRSNKEYGWLKRRRSRIVSRQLRGNKHTLGKKLIRTKAFCDAISERMVGNDHALGKRFVPRTTEHTENHRQALLKANRAWANNGIKSTLFNKESLPKGWSWGRIDGHKRRINYE